MGNEVITLQDISEVELAAKGVVALATRPNAPSRYGEGGLSADTLKGRFDRLAGVLAERINTIHDYLRADDLAENIKVDINAVGKEGIPTLAALAVAIENGEAAKYFTVEVGTEEYESLQEAITDILTTASEDAAANDNNFRDLNVRVDGLVQNIVIETIVSLEKITVRLTRYSDKGATLGSEEFDIPNAPYLIDVHNESEEAHADIRSAVTKNAEDIRSLGYEIDDVRDIANGRVRARAFDDWNSALSTIAGYSYDATLTDFAIGDQIYIRQSEAPDAWVSGFSTAFEAYPGGLVNVDPFSGGEASLHVGYLILSPLEAPDVDFSDYATLAFANNAANGAASAAKMEAIAEAEEYADAAVAEVRESTENAVQDSKDYVDESVAEAKAYVNEAINSFDPPSADKVERLEAQVANLTAQIAPEYFETDASVAYGKAVPSGALPYAEVTEVGGMSYAEGGEIKNAAVTAIESVGVNLLDLTPALNSALVDNGDSTYTITKNGSNRLSEKIPIFVPAGQRIFVYFELVDTNMENTTIYLQHLKADGTSTGSGGGMVNGGGSNTPSSDTYFMRLYLRDTEVDGSYITFKNPMIKYGESAIFSPYVKHTLPIPAEVQALEGWGLGIAATYNRIVWDPENGVKQYRQEVAKIRIDGTEEWHKSTASHIFQAGTPLAKLAGDTRTIRPIISNGYGFSDWYNPDGVKPYFRIVPNGDRLWIEATVDQFADVDAWKAYLSANPVEIVYPLATPIVTDLPTVLGDDNFIKVEEGGTLTAQNANMLAAPTTVIYQKKEATE